MLCLRCGNTEKVYFYHAKDGWYCRKCIAFGRVNVYEEPNKACYKKKKHQCHYELKYPLTKAQKNAAQEIMVHCEHHLDTLVYAACGAGKTELVMGVIQTYLNQGKKVGFAISRRQVVLEIKERMQQAFQGLYVIAVCEGHTDVVDGDLIVCTMHQLYRYHKTFDLLIMDEVDAFPYRDNEVLEHIAKNASIGEIVYLTATPNEEMLQEVNKGNLKLVELFQRPHGYPLIIPDVKCGLESLQLYWLVRFLKQQRKENIQSLVFVPTIHLAHRLHFYLKWVFRCAVFTSKTKDKEKVIEEFHHQKYQFLLSTTILERGITIKGIYVVILFADHPVFNEASLIQMIGRVGRNIEMPTGKGLFLCMRKTKDIQNCVKALKKMNEQAPV